MGNTQIGGTQVVRVTTAGKSSMWAVISSRDEAENLVRRQVQPDAKVELTSQHLQPEQAAKLKKLTRYGDACEIES
jgi:hypothetical protein